MVKNNMECLKNIQSLSIYDNNELMKNKSLLDKVSEIYSYIKKLNLNFYCSLNERQSDILLTLSKISQFINIE